MLLWCLMPWITDLEHDFHSLFSNPSRQSPAEVLTVTGEPAKPRPRRRTGSSQMAFQSWPRNPSSRRRRCYSWSVSPGQCRSCSSDPSPQRSRGRRAACSGHWASTGQTCRQCGSLSRCESWNTRWSPSHARCTASQRAQRGAGSSGCRCHQTWGCRWVLGAGRPAWRRSCWGTAGSRTGSTAHWGIGGSSCNRGQGKWRFTKKICPSNLSSSVESGERKGRDNSEGLIKQDRSCFRTTMPNWPQQPSRLITRKYHKREVMPRNFGMNDQKNTRQLFIFPQNLKMDLTGTYWL